MLPWRVWNGDVCGGLARGQSQQLGGLPSGVLSGGWFERVVAVGSLCGSLSLCACGYVWVSFGGGSSWLLQVPESGNPQVTNGASYLGLTWVLEYPAGTPG